VDRISKGDTPPQITDSYNGDFNTIKNNLNVLIAAMNDITAAAEEVATITITPHAPDLSDSCRSMRELAARSIQVQQIIPITKRSTGHTSQIDRTTARVQLWSAGYALNSALPLNQGA
jgi:methyl-accepting chemotaxis protein